MAQPTQVRQIRISIDTKGNRDLKAVADALGGMQNKLKSVAGTMDFFKKTFVAAFAGMGLREIVGMADSMQLLRDRIAVLSGGTENANGIMSDLMSTADRTKSSIDGLAEVYSRVAASTKNLGVSTGGMLQITELLQNSFRVSGSTIAESTATIVQLSQAFASGELRGQELRSVMEQNVYIATKLREEYGKDIYKKAADGAITAADFLRILFKNQNDINNSAKQLSQTFEQTLTLAMNKLKGKIAELNDSWGLSSKFATGMDKLIKNIDLVGWGIAILAVTQIPKLILAVKALQAATLAFIASNPITLAFAAIASAAVLVITRFDEVKASLREIVAAAIDLPAFGAKVAKDIYEVSASMISGKKVTTDFFDNFIQKSFELAENMRAKPMLGPSKEEFERESKALKERDQLMKALSGKGTEKEKKVKEILSQINKEYISGAISADQYFMKLRQFESLKLFREFRDGKTNLNAYKIGLNELKAVDIDKLFSAGLLSLRDFNKEMGNIGVEKLNIQLQAGIISLKEYESALLKIEGKVGPGGSIRAGSEAYIDSVGTMASQLAEAVNGAFKTLEDQIFEMTKSGQFNFNTMAQAILDDLNRIAIRMLVVKPLAESIFGAFAPSSPQGETAPAGNFNFSTTAATGAAFDHGIKKFARGGLVTSPTMFGYGGNKLGLMGEAGTEAIMPLTRTSNGNLGVQATTAPVIVNITNNTAATIETSENTGPSGERVISVIIDQKVKEGLARGAYDTVMNQSYGIKRRGS